VGKKSGGHRLQGMKGGVVVEGSSAMQKIGPKKGVGKKPCLSNRERGTEKAKEESALPFSKTKQKNRQRGGRGGG